jgi:hypothetical protein
MPTILGTLYDRKYGDDEIQKSCEQFVEEALKDARRKFIKSTNLPLSVSLKILLKLKSAKIFCGFDEKVMKNFSLDTFYKEILENDFTFYPIEGKKTFNVVQMKRFGRKIITTPKNDARRLITMKANHDWFEIVKSVEDFEYDIEGENLLCEDLKLFSIYC